MLAAHTHAPIVTKTAMRANSLQTLHIFAELGVQTVRGDLVVLAVLDVLLSVEKPVRDLVLTRVGDNGHNAIDLDKPTNKHIFTILCNLTYYLKIYFKKKKFLIVLLLLRSIHQLSCWCRCQPCASTHARNGDQYP